MPTTSRVPAPWLIILQLHTPLARMLQAASWSQVATIQPNRPNPKRSTTISMTVVPRPWWAFIISLLKVTQVLQAKTTLISRKCNLVNKCQLGSIVHQYPNNKWIIIPRYNSHQWKGSKNSSWWAQIRMKYSYLSSTLNKSTQTTPSKRLKISSINSSTSTS